MKHRIKQLVRKLYAYALFYTGAHRLVDRCMPRRLTVLCGHCVDEPRLNGDLPADMRVSPAKLRRMLSWFAKRYQVCTLSEGLDSLQQARTGRSLVALTMDDGYRDNAEVLPRLLAETGARATVFLESRALDERRLNWSHKYFWLLTQLGVEHVGARLIELATDEALRGELSSALGRESRLEYHLKRALKYKAVRAERDRVVDALFDAVGGDERALCERIYMDWSGAQTLLEAGIELGGHTAQHPVLSTLAPEEQLTEVRGGRAAIEKATGVKLRAFAYPFGRDWDFDVHSVQAVREAGFESAVTTHAGTNDASADPMRLARLTFDDETDLRILVAEACGGFELARRCGLDLSE